MDNDDFLALKLQRERALLEKSQREEAEDRSWRRREGGDRAANAELREMMTQELQRRSALVQALKRTGQGGQSLPREGQQEGISRQATPIPIKYLKKTHSAANRRRPIPLESKYPAGIVLPKSIAKALPPVSRAPKPMSISKIECIVADAFSGKMKSIELVESLCSRPGRGESMDKCESVPSLIASEAARAAVVMKNQSVSLSVAALRSVHECKLKAISDLHSLVDAQRSSILSFVDTLVDDAGRNISTTAGRKVECVERLDKEAGE